MATKEEELRKQILDRNLQAASDKTERILRKKLASEEERSGGVRK
ncbi:MAG: hypothetical protein V3U19_03720 [Thermodesulfobacteriota bacterium]